MPKKKQKHLGSAEGGRIMMKTQDPGQYRAVREVDEDSYGASRGEDDAVSMDPSLASPVQLSPFSCPAVTGAFERAIADPALAGVDFLMEEPAARSQAHPQHSATSQVEFSPWASAQAVGRHRREEKDDQEMAIHEPAQRWGDLDGGAEGLDDDDGIELLNLGQLQEGHGLGGGEGMSRGKMTSVRAFTHVLKSYIGSGVLGLPYAYSQARILKHTLYIVNLPGH
jgi:hypothetical protein